MLLTRRTFLLAASLPFCAPALAQGTRRHVHVLKDPNCGCCTDWVEHLRGAGFAPTVEEIDPDRLAARKAQFGVPPDLQSCHTAEVDGYILEGHVPATDIDRLLAERPEALGLAVPGMPYGAPGMGPESERDAYEVVLFRKDGSTEVWASYAAA